MVSIRLKSDIPLKGDAWVNAIDSLSDIFKERTNYNIFLMSTVIGILYDKQIEELTYTDETNAPPSVPRNVFNTASSDIFDYLFQTAILTTKTVEYDETERLDLAFNDKRTEYNRIQLLVKFANYGVTKLLELVGDDNLETMENIKNFLTSTVEGTNWDIDDLVIDEL